MRRKYCETLQEKGILAKETHDTTIRFAPPLIIDKETIDWALDKNSRNAGLTLVIDILTKMNRRAKIVATFGPSSNTKEIIEKLVQSGLDIARLNFSHGTQQSHFELIKIIR